VTKVWVTGAGGFVGSNITYVLGGRHGLDLFAPSHAELDLTDARAVARAGAAERPDAIIHSAILNDFLGLSRNREKAWANFVGATRNVVDAANALDAPVVLISTDWVFDGCSPPAPAAEDAPPNPINTYGFLKAACELVVLERARHPIVARVAGVQGVHRARSTTLREQDAGFGYLVASMVDALREGRPFTVWDGPGLNALATPTLATDAAALIWRAIEVEARGILHCVGGEHADRVTLARRAVETYDLDASLLRTGPPPPGAIPDGVGIPRDTRLDATRTAQRLGVTLPDLDTTLARLGEQLDPAWRTAA
jgi:dTDP-4-dehydrorhamnose reductase